MKTRLGILLVLISSVSFGAMAIFAHMAYRDGVEPVTLLGLRFSIAAAIMLVICLARRERWPRGRTLLGVALMGAAGYVGQSLCYFTALTLADAGLVAVLLYLYPAIVTLASAAVGREKLTPVKALAVALALAGTAMAVGPRFNAQPLGIVLGIGAAFIYSGYILAGNRLLARAAPLTSSTVIMASAAVVFLGLGAARGMTLPHGVTGWVGVAGVAVVCTVVAATLFLVGLKAIGPTNASVLSTFEPITTVALGILVLGEQLTIWIIVGALCVVCATVILATAHRPEARPGVSG